VSKRTRQGAAEKQRDQQAHADDRRFAD